MLAHFQTAEFEAVALHTSLLPSDKNQFEAVALHMAKRHESISYCSEEQCLPTLTMMDASANAGKIKSLSSLRSCLPFACSFLHVDFCMFIVE